MRILSLLASLLATGCLGGTMVTSTIGPAFGNDGAGVSLSLEVTHIRVGQPSQRGEYTPPRRSGGSGGIGIAATAATHATWMSNFGAFATVSAGLDYLAFFRAETDGQGRARSSSTVGFGAQVGYARGADASAIVLAGPRLWWVATPWRSGNAQWGPGIIFRCQLPTASDSIPMGCGPALMLSRIQLGRTSS